MRCQDGEGDCSSGETGGMVRGLRINLLGVVDGKEERRIVHDSTLSDARNEGGSALQGRVAPSGKCAVGPLSLIHI